MKTAKRIASYLWKSLIFFLTMNCSLTLIAIARRQMLSLGGATQSLGGIANAQQTLTIHEIKAIYGSGVLVFALGLGMPARSLWRTAKRRIRQSRKPRDQPRVNDPWALSAPLLALSPKDVWTVGHAVEGTAIFGATGSGKTSGSGRAIAQAMLKAGFGMLVLTAKADERKLWQDYCRMAGRIEDLVIFSPKHPWRFNFLNFEATRKGEGAGHTENIVGLLTTVLEVADRGSGQGSGREDEGYWRRAMRQLVRNLVELLMLAKGRVSVPDLYRLVVSAPTSPEHIRSAEWKAKSFLFQCLAEADRNTKTETQHREMEIVADFFMLEFPGLSDKTRSVIVSTFTSMIDVLNRGILRDLFCGETNINPEVTEEGKVLLIDLPVKEFAQVGVIAQVLWKHAFQRALERRDTTQNRRPIALWADEAQYFVTSHDMQFQTTCRSSLIATVLLTQNLSNLYAALGGNEKGRSEADSLLANLNTKIFHANACPITNEFASSLIGRTRQMFMNAGQSRQPGDWIGSATGLGPQPQTSAGMSEQLSPEIEPSQFTRLRTGGPANGGIVDAIVFRNGAIFRATGRTWLPLCFQQKTV